MIKIRPEQYDLDVAVLEKQYKESQKKMHPDKFTLATDVCILYS